MAKTIIWKRIVPICFLSAAIFLVAQSDLTPTGDQQFLVLAKSFLEGHLYFTYVPGYWGDTSLFENHHYWPLGPLPAVLLMPFVALFGFEMQQGYLALACHLLNLLLLYKIARQITGKTHVALWLSFGYVFSTAYLYVACRTWSWYFAQVIATSFLLLALHEYFFKRRWWLVGVYLALGAATRINIIFAGVFFGLSILFTKEKQRTRMFQIFEVSASLALVVLLLFLYNYLRFHTLFEFGYSYQLLYGESAATRVHGLWSFIHFPANLYYFLFKGPEGVFLSGTRVLTYPFLKPDYWGMSILFTSPILLWGLAASGRDRTAQLSLLTSGVMLVVLFGYYGIGGRQFGYRYAMDFYPFLFVLLAKESQTKFTTTMQAVIILSFLLNWYLIHFV